MNLSTLRKFVLILYHLVIVRRLQPPVYELLKNKVIVLSDFDKSVYKKKELTNELIKLGARIETSITKETNILVVGNVLKNTTKITKAKKNSSIEIIQLDKFLEKYATHLTV